MESIKHRCPENTCFGDNDEPCRHTRSRFPPSPAPAACPREFPCYNWIPVEAGTIEHRSQANSGIIQDEFATHVVRNGMRAGVIPQDRFRHNP
jgi:hypothetical protein